MGAARSSVPTPASAAGSGTYIKASATPIPILVLDRDTATVDALSCALPDFTLHTAQCAAEALSVVELARPRLAIVGARLPALQILFFTRTLRAACGTSIPIVFVTAPGDPERVVLALRLGARACIDSAFDFERVRTVVLKHVI